MDMDISNDRDTVRPAVRPQFAEISAIEANDTRFETIRIEVVVQDVINDSPSTVDNVT